MNVFNNTYPRKQFERNSFHILDNWTLNGKPINVPYPKESILSNYENKKHEEELIYETSFDLSGDLLNKENNIILNLGAVDQVCNVYLNDKKIGHHEGGYLPFHFDITNLVKERDNELIIEAIDNIDTLYPYGKQCKVPHDMWYTPVSGVWQPIWLEAVPNKDCVNSIKVTTTPEKIIFDIDTEAINYILQIPELNFKQVLDSNHYEIDYKEIKDIQYWTVDNPHLYDFTISTSTDTIKSYFAIRYIETKTINGYPRIFLNDKPLFIHAVLDQGYFEEGIFLPKDVDGYKQDILNMKELGINTLRKHIKVEPDIFYYLCDKLGMMVMQDMVNSGPYSLLFDTLLPNIRVFIQRPRFFDGERYDFFLDHSKGIINHLYNHPSVIAYTIYNEGWGQQWPDNAYYQLKQADPTRLFDSTSGWFKKKLSDFESRHIYFRNEVAKSHKKHPLLISECGGYKRSIEGHLYKTDSEYGYGITNSEEELTSKIEEMYQKMVIASIPYGCCGCVYTQISDVEIEINGLYTYDRQVCKVNKQRMFKVSQQIFEEYKNNCKSLK